MDSHVSIPVDELVQLRELQIKRLKQVEAELRRHIQWCAQTVHNAHHQDQHDRTWELCTHGFCQSARRVLEESR